MTSRRFRSIARHFDLMGGDIVGMLESSKKDAQYVVQVRPEFGGRDIAAAVKLTGDNLGELEDHVVEIVRQRDANDRTHARRLLATL